MNQQTLDDLFTQADEALPVGWHLAEASRMGADWNWSVTASLACGDDGLFGCAGFYEISAQGATFGAAIDALIAACANGGAERHYQAEVERRISAGQLYRPPAGESAVQALPASPGH